MRDPVNVFYYPDMIASGSTLKKAILFLDEIHFRWRTRPDWDDRSRWTHKGKLRFQTSGRYIRVREGIELVVNDGMICNERTYIQDIVS
jgi:hypothetical protein